MTEIRLLGGHVQKTTLSPEEFGNFYASALASGKPAARVPSITGAIYVIVPAVVSWGDDGGLQIA